MGGDGDFDQGNAQQVEIEDVLDNLPWENKTAESENSVCTMAYWKDQTSKYYKWIG
jgi:hypothetical protein